MIIESKEDPRIAEFISLKNKNLLEKGLIVVESHKVVKKLIESKHKVIKVFLEESYYKENKEFYEGIQVLLGSKEVMQEIVGHKLHHGVMALAELPTFSELNELDDKVIIFNGLSSPENVGTIVRTARALNINSLIFDDKTCSPYLRRCIRVSMGNVFRMKVHRTRYLERTIEFLKENDYRVYGTANENGALEIENKDFENRSCIIIGSEGHGMDDSVKEACNNLIKINVNEHVEHLNASAAAAICLYKLSSLN